MADVFDRKGRCVLFVSVLVVTVALLAATGTVAAQSAPDCSTVEYDGDGTEANPYEVSNVDQLQCIENQDLDANYIQVSDIDASETASWNGGDGFAPIANDTDGSLGFQGTEFTGTFDGAGYAISGLTIDRESTDHVGLFGLVDTPGHIKNVGVENVDITGSDIVGGLIGFNGATVTDSYATGDISATGRMAYGSGNVFDTGSVGGLAGENGGIVERSYATSDVSGEDEKVTRVGGLVGGNGGTVTESYATGDVSGASDVGGLVGVNAIDATITNSYATGDVTGNDLVGGLVGSNFNAMISDTYATGDVSGNDRVGGIVGTSGGTVRESYWDTETTGQSLPAAGTGLITSEMIGSAATSNMQGFDFTSTWKTVPDDYPILAWQTGGNGGTNTIDSGSNGDGERDGGTEGGNGGSNGADGENTAENSSGIEGSEGLPGFTVVTAVLTLLTVIAAAARRRKK